MADTVRFDPYQVFMRKVGYSVGLENTLDRIIDLAELYERDGQVTFSAWKNLVHVVWGLKNDNIGDFFRALGLIDRSNTSLNVLQNLDIFGILVRSLENDELRKASQLALLVIILEVDGDIFLNCLSANFDDVEIVRVLTACVEEKRAKLFEIYPSPEIRAAIARAVTIDRQERNSGGGAPAKGLAESRRLTPLRGRTETLSRSPQIEPVVISSDYLRKVPPRRRDWATSIGLWSEGYPTSEGTALLRRLDALGLRKADGHVVVWPFSHEISRLRLNPVLFDGRVLDHWELVKLALVGVGVDALDEVPSPDEVALVTDELIAHVEAFRSLNKPKAILRRELPLTVGYVTLAAVLSARGGAVPDLKAIVDAEWARDGGRLELRSSRTSVGTVSLRLGAR